MRVMIDACVLYPTVMRQMVMGAASKGLFVPRWTARILEEWARAGARMGHEEVARGEIALLRAQWSKAEVAAGQKHGLWLPDADDIHVLAAAISSGCDVILTMNAKDFPRGTLQRNGLSRLDPDGFLCGLTGSEPAPMALVAAEVLAEARRLSGEDWTLRRLMKKARLPRTGKALERLSG